MIDHFIAIHAKNGMYAPPAKNDIMLSSLQQAAATVGRRGAIDLV